MKDYPRLYTTPARVQRAKERIQSEEWARDLLRGLVKKADSSFSLELPVFETDWWQEVKGKHWGQFYPEIHRHCNEVPGPLWRAAHDGALAYQLTGEEKYAVRAKEILFHLSGFSFAFEHPDVGMLYSMMALKSLQAFDMIRDYFSEDDSAVMSAFFKLALDAVKKNDGWWVANNPGGMFNNHFAWHKLWIGTYGLYFDQDDLLDYAIESDQGIRELIEHGMLDGGAWFESSLNYHFTTVWAVVKLAQMLRNSGHGLDLFTRTFANGRTVKQFFDGIIPAAFPDTSLPTIGDAYGKQAYLSQQPLFGDAFDAYNDPAYEWLLVKGGKRDIDWLFWERIPSEGKAPAVYTQLFPEHGHAMLRSVEGSGYWGSDGFAAFFSYDINSIHSHSDKLDLILFGRGKLLLADPEALASAPHAFSSQVQKELNRTTICHNTLMVDGREQAPIGEKLMLMEFKDLPEVKTVSAADMEGRIYPGVRMQRTVSVTKDYVLDVFQAASDVEHDYQWLLHPCDEEGCTGTMLDLKPVQLPKEPPWNWLKNALGGVTSNDFTAEWIQDDVILRLTLLASPETRITVCDFPRSDDFKQTPFPMLIAERKAKSTIFVALYQAERGNVPDAVLSAAPERHNSLRVTVTIAGKQMQHLLPNIA